MDDYIGEMFEKIRKETGSLLELLGLELVVAHVGKAYRISTVAKGENTCISPVTIVFDDASVSYLDEATWQDARIEVDIFTRRDLGDTGWEYWKHEFTQRRYPYETKGSKLGWAWMNLLNEGLVGDGARTPNCVDSPETGRAYLLLSRHFDDVAIHQAYDEAEDDIVETLSFTDEAGRDVRLRVPSRGQEVVMYVDDEEFASYAKDCPEDLKIILGRLRNDLAARSATP